MNEGEYLNGLLLLREQLQVEQKVGIRPCAFMEEFLHLSREEQDYCIKYIDQLSIKLRLIQKQQDKELAK